MIKEILENYKSGFVTLIGRPNVGKSTLINKLIGEKIAITSPVAQTTRKKVKGILTTKNSQIIFIDTPGIHKPHHLLGKTLVKNAKSAINGVDLILLIFDSNNKPGRGDKYIKDLLSTNKSKYIIVLNKWDQVDENEKDLRLNQYKEIFPNNSICFQTVSSISGEGCDQLINLVNDHLPRGPMLYPNDLLSDQPFNILLGELIREQVLINTREEIPHSVAVIIEKIEEVKNKKSTKGNLTSVLATVVVEKKSQKGILIGKKGSMLKIIGQAARINMKKLIEGPIYLELFVKVIPNWRKKESKLAEFGYQEDF